MCGICGFVGRADEVAGQAMAARSPTVAPMARASALRVQGRECPGHAGAPAAEHHRSHRAWRAADGLRGRPLLDHLQRRALQLPRAAAGAEARRSTSSPPTATPRCCWRCTPAHGPAMLQRLNGIYAFAIWDSEAGELFLARDRLGVKPLYYAEHDGALYFASEVKAILPALPRPGCARSRSLDYLTFLWVPDPEHHVRGRPHAPAGPLRDIRRRASWRSAEWWDMTLRAGGRRSGDEWAELRAGVRSPTPCGRQKVADVPLGALPLGRSRLQRDRGRPDAATRDPVTTYTVGFSARTWRTRRPRRHELRAADGRRSSAGLPRADRSTPDIVDLLPKLVWHMDEPVADPAAITTYLICSAARERLTVVLCGHGRRRDLRRLSAPPCGSDRPACGPVPARRPVGPGRARWPQPDDGQAGPACAARAAT